MKGDVIARVREQRDAAERAWSPGRLGVCAAPPAAGGPRRPAGMGPARPLWPAWLTAPSRPFVSLLFPQVSPSRRGHRNSAKYMRYQQVISQCPRCKRAFMQHVIPKKCAEGTCTSTP